MGPARPGFRRERLNRLLGLWGADTDWQISGELSQEPSSDLPMRGQDKFEALAIDVRSEIRELRDELASKREIARFYRDELLPGQRQILNGSLLNYNAMEIGNFGLFTTKAEEARTEREYIGSVRGYLYEGLFAALHR